MAVALDAVTGARTADASVSVPHTPSGTPRGVLVFLEQYTGTMPLSLSLSYGGVAMTEVTGSPAVTTAGENCATYGFFLGSSVPTGTQNLTFTNSGTESFRVVIITVTASGDTAVQNTAKIENFNPGPGDITTTLALSGETCFVALGAETGHNNPALPTPLTGWTEQDKEDPGDQTCITCSYDTVSDSDVTVGLNFGLSDDIALLAVAIKEDVTRIIGGSDITINAARNQSVTGEVVITNTGTDTLTISGIAFAAVSDSGGTLTYSGATSDTIAASGQKSYYVTFAPTSHPTTATATLTFTSDDTEGNGTFVVNITGNSLHYWVPGGGLPSRPIGPGSPAIVASPSQPNRGIQLGLRLWKNTEFSWDFVTTVGGWSDTVTKLRIGHVDLATNTGLTAVAGINLSNINKLMLQPIGGKSVVQCGSQTCLIKDGGCLLLANVSNLSTFKMSNPDTVHAVRVHVFASGGSLTASDPRGKKDTSQEISNPY